MKKIKLNFIPACCIAGICMIIISGCKKESTTTTPMPISTSINFDAVATQNSGFINASNYLSTYGISISNVSPASTTVGISNTIAIYGGTAVLPTSNPNVISQFGSNGPVSFDLNFATPLSSFSFKRTGLIGTGPSGITHPAWTAKAYSTSNVLISVVSEGRISSYVNVPASSFLLTGPNIAYIRFEANNVITAFSSVVMDDFNLTR